MNLHDLFRMLQKVSDAMLSQQGILVSVGNSEQHQNIVRIDTIGEN